MVEGRDDVLARSCNPGVNVAQRASALDGIAREIGDIAHLVAALAGARHIGAYRDGLRVAGIGHDAHVVGAGGPVVALGAQVAVEVGIGAARPHVDDVRAAADGVDLDGERVGVAGEAVGDVDNDLFLVVGRLVIKIDGDGGCLGDHRAAAVTREIVAQRDRCVAALGGECVGIDGFAGRGI